MLVTAYYVLVVRVLWYEPSYLPSAVLGLILPVSCVVALPVMHVIVDVKGHYMYTLCRGVLQLYDKV